jgi:hypothetical protein
MRIEGHNSLNQPFKLDCTRVLVFDDYNNPVAVIVKHRHGALYIGQAGDKDFESCLIALGIKNTSIIEPIEIDTDSFNLGM